MDEEQIRAQREKCFECGGQLQEVKLIDRADHNTHTETIYAARDARRNKWTGGFPVEGNVLAFLCSRCGRIAIYGAALNPQSGRQDNADR